jgi:signal transduction histidine kinase/CHASE3 domain sensor protein
MNLRDIFTSSSFIRSVLVISLFVLIFIFSVSYKHTIALRESTELLVHSYKIQIKLEQLLSRLKDAEIGQRGYIISKDTIFLRPYNSAHQQVNEPYLQLKSLIVNNPKQQNNLDSLVVLINLRFALLARSLELDVNPEINKSALNENMVRGKDVMDKILSQINQMTYLETLHFEEQQRKYTHEIYFTPNFTLFLLFFSLMVFVFSFIKINKNLIALKKTNEDLSVTTESFRHAEEIGNFSSWQWYLDSNKFVFSDNLYGLLGCTPHSFEPTIKNFLEFVHPDDRHILTDGVALAMKGVKPATAFYRIIRHDGELRYFKSVSKLTDLSKVKLLIGINSDITEQQLSSTVLEERNRELEQSNKELASFNHIASHDLQEPLRKIQTFISRISEKESLNLSDAGKEYFTKIQSSIFRMRNLIDDLLQFSRTTKTEKKFEPADLNLLLENAKQELIQDIEDKKAEIHSAELPVLNVIPFQIQQLFINLIGNSLKYGKLGIVPVITINYEEINAEDYPFLNDKIQKKYHRISITDNGQGFEQQYAEDIFLLFYRLHSKSELAGSGIGLSICKKIVENHNGYILAESNPGIGSTFSFFLPY